MKTKQNIKKQEQVKFHSGDQIKVLNVNGNTHYFMICKSFDFKYILVVLGSDANKLWYNSGYITIGNGETACPEDFTTISELIDNLKHRYEKVEKVHLELVETDDETDD